MTEYCNSSPDEQTFGNIFHTYMENILHTKMIQLKLMKAGSRFLIEDHFHIEFMSFWSFLVLQSCLDTDGSSHRC